MINIQQINISEAVRITICFIYNIVIAESNITNTNIILDNPI